MLRIPRAVRRWSIPLTVAVTAATVTISVPASAEPSADPSAPAASAPSGKVPVAPPARPRATVDPITQPGIGQAKPSTRSTGKLLLAESTAARAAALAAAPVGTGPAKQATLVPFEISDRIQARVNVGSGNLLVQSSDLKLPGIKDDVQLGMAYNSLFVGSDIDAGSFSKGWKARVGTDVKLVAAGDGSVTYVAADGVTGVFKPTAAGASTYTTPGEFKGKLAKGAVSGWTLQENGGRKLTFNAAGVLTNWTDRNGNVTDIVLDDTDRETAITSNRGGTSARTAVVARDANDRITSYTQHADGVPGQRKVTYTYANLQLTSIRSDTDRTTTFDYDTAGNLAGITVTNATGYWRKTAITYDSSRRVTSVTKIIDGPAGTGATTRFAYPSATQTLMADANTDLSKAITSVPRTVYTVNTAKRVTQSVDPAGFTRTATYTPFNDVASATAAEGGSVTNTYGSNAGQSKTASKASTGAATSTAYANPATAANPTANFQSSSSTDRQGNVSTSGYDAKGNHTSTKDALAAEAKVSHNSDGTVATSTDPANGTNATKYGYEATTKHATGVTPVTGSSLGGRAYTYDGYSRLKTATDGAGRTVTYTYDNDDRPATIAFSDGTPTVRYNYDGGGYLQQRDDGNGTVYFEYNLLNQMTKRSATTGGGDLFYGHDPVGNVTSSTDLRGTTGYVYDARNLLTSMTTVNGTRYGFDYTKDGLRKNTWFNTNAGNTVWSARTTVAYATTGRLSRITTVRNSAAPVTVSDVSSCYTPIGHATCSDTTADKGLVNWELNHATDVRSEYTYDKGNRLTKATNVAGSTWVYTYDANGNRKTVTRGGTATQTLAFNPANQVTTTGNSYDGTGNQLAGAGLNSPALKYNAAGQMIENGGTRYYYSGPDQNEFITTGTADLVYGRPDTNGLPTIQSYTYHYADGATTKGYVDRDGTGTLLGATIDAKDMFYVRDRLGTVRAIIDTTATVVANYTYDPYGAVLSSTGVRAEHNPFRYTGAYQDTFYDLGTNFTKLGRRWYHAEHGRFTQQDSLTFLANPALGNRYAYVGGNPVNYTDPTGFGPFGPDWLTCGLAVAGYFGGIAALSSTGIGLVLAVGLLAGSIYGMLDGCYDDNREPIGGTS
ncbi:RHS repeat domain-containing protein [Actinoplanes sp. M2I2]|uniref:RHS repeat domain-containing protein n=1 Tax=Actinoplanes sp. M2I2 TaxID=1734444 RepID=UPI0020223FCC|nr:RHS repeat-associated core domain-containing protein [Actinoplanes sp. M2I2]